MITRVWVRNSEVKSIIILPVLHQVILLHRPIFPPKITSGTTLIASAYTRAPAISISNPAGGILRIYIYSLTWVYRRQSYFSRKELEANPNTRGIQNVDDVYTKNHRMH
ncbi:hypothetical protein TWF751_006294 [Orbilia oligospora]|nr:hypothetical protein TWF751_006294 [Orbilia oligospora]